MSSPIDALTLDPAGVWEAKGAFLADSKRLDDPIPEQAMASLRVSRNLRWSQPFWNDFGCHPSPHRANSGTWKNIIIRQGEQAL